MSDVSLQLSKLITGSCTCDTKTPELKWHETWCRYRVAQEVTTEVERQMAVIKPLRDLVIQYRDDLKHPPTDSGSIQRRLEAIDAVLNPPLNSTEEQR